jgi:hypothetical protein
MITRQEDLILQSYFTVSLLVELGKNQFFSSDYFKSMSFGSPDIKKFLEKNGVDNQGSAIMSLYAMLVVPCELIKDNYEDEFSEMNVFLAQKTKMPVQLIKIRSRTRTSCTTYEMPSLIAGYHLRKVTL